MLHILESTLLTGWYKQKAKHIHMHACTHTYKLPLKVWKMQYNAEKLEITSAYA